MNNILEYSIQLAMLRQLLIEKLIDKREYFKIKEVLMEKYNISSDLTC
ncbi:SHOCT domain-containing protein [Clostridium cochlearium]|nr:SHOCT domain-containing protein [Clostridium cochlearium]MCR1971497.1 conjugal transfer protein [Clostridium cochlearium]